MREWLKIYFHLSGFESHIHLLISSARTVYTHKDALNIQMMRCILNTRMMRFKSSCTCTKVKPMTSVGTWIRWGHKGHSQLEAREASVLRWRQWIVVTINFCLSVFLNECDHRDEPVSDASCRSMLARAESHLVARASKTNKTKVVPFLQWFGD